MEMLSGIMDDVVHTDVTLHDPRHAEAFDQVYSTFFTPPYPARNLVGVCVSQERAALPERLSRVAFPSRTPGDSELTAAGPLHHREREHPFSGNLCATVWRDEVDWRD